MAAMEHKDLSPLQAVAAALRPLRLLPQADEAALQDHIALALQNAGIPFTREARLATGRIDFLTADGVGIEVKRGRPAPGALLAQLSRYAACPEVRALALVVERSARLPREVGGKPCALLCLNRQWGVALR